MPTQPTRPGVPLERSAETADTAHSIVLPSINSQIPALEKTIAVAETSGVVQRSRAEMGGAKLRGLGYYGHGARQPLIGYLPRWTTYLNSLNNRTNQVELVIDG